jgi:rhamnosyltransferase subunit B
VRVLMSTFGSEGDLNPPVAIGKALQQFGAEIDFIANPFYEERIVSQGMTFVGAGPFKNVDDMIKADPRLMHPLKGPGQVWKMLLGSVEEVFPVACEQIKQQRPDIIVSHAIELGAQWAARKYEIPYVTVSTTPLIWGSKDDPIVWGARKCPNALRAGAIRLFMTLSEIYFSFSTRKLRQQCNLPGPYGSMGSIFTESVLNLGCWSPLYRTETPHDPPNARITGFTIERQRDPARISDSVTDWLVNDSPPVIVGLGSTARWQGRHIYEAVAKACASLQKRCLLIGPGLSDLENSDSGIRSIPEIPFREVFPYAHLLVHHGGLSTTAQALFAGRPQLVVPFAHDQFDNGARINRLGAGLSLPAGKISEASVRKLFEQLLNSPEMNERAKSLAQQFQQEPYGPEQAAKAILGALSEKGAIKGLV